MRILVVEDDALIALDVETMLSGMGHSVLGIAATSADARTMLDRATPDLVLLDINLGHGPDFDLARLLHGLAVPFVFTSGYAVADTLPDGLRGVPCLDKPFSHEALARLLEPAR
ncbi:MAG: response regulator [Geminicoccaceae bacterium]|nr:response regulator [Geminicoccaceae bacterium]